jgi:hypothetical protein
MDVYRNDSRAVDQVVALPSGYLDPLPLEYTISLIAPRPSTLLFYSLLFSTTSYVVSSKDDMWECTEYDIIESSDKGRERSMSSKLRRIRFNSIHLLSVTCLLNLWERLLFVH